MKELMNYPHIPFSTALNFLDIPITRFDTDEEGMKEWNAVVGLVVRYNEQEEIYHELIRTPSGGISMAVENFGQFPGWDVLEFSNSMVELTLIDQDGCWRFQFRHKLQKGKDISGRTAYLKLEEVCKKFNVDIRSLMLPDMEAGLAVKKTIEKPRIDMRPEILNITFSNANHIDIHSAHMAGVAFAFPQLREPIQHCYDNRKRYAIYKHILTHAWGYFQSKFSPVYYRLSHLSKAGLDYTNSVVDDLTVRLEEAGRMVLGHNTDGIWYAGEPYHGAGEGSDLGQWQNDVVNARFRARSKGSYEYIDADGSYHPIVRGKTKLDEVMKRDEWQWGDIYNYGTIPVFYLREDKLIEKSEVETV